jgi:hypothetical protein
LPRAEFPAVVAGGGGATVGLAGATVAVGAIGATVAVGLAGATVAVGAIGVAVAGRRAGAAVGGSGVGVTAISGVDDSTREVTAVTAGGLRGVDVTAGCVCVAAGAADWATRTAVDVGAAICGGGAEHATSVNRRALAARAVTFLNVITCLPRFRRYLLASPRLDDRQQSRLCHCFYVGDSGIGFIPDERTARVVHRDR